MKIKKIKPTKVKVRKVFKFNPVTRVVPSSKGYSRAKAKRAVQKEIDNG